MSTAGALPITRYTEDVVTTARPVIFVLVVEKLYLPLQAFDFANVNYPRVSSHNGVTSFNIRLI